MSVYTNPMLLFVFLRFLKGAWDLVYHGQNCDFRGILINPIGNRGAARYLAKFMGESSFFDIVIISLFIKR